MAYLADGHEIENDATNYWIFSPAGLLRILQRTRWAIVATERVGCLNGSNPIDPNADERMFVLAKSRVHFPELQVRLLHGWHPSEGTFRWTAKTFSIGLVLPLEQPLTGFSLLITVPQAIATQDRPIFISCSIGGRTVGSSRYCDAGSYLFQGELPPFALHERFSRSTSS